MELGGDAKFSQGDGKSISGIAQTSIKNDTGALKKYFVTVNDDTSVLVFVRKLIAGLLFLLWH
ncbi:MULTISPECIES: hypothetical protein [Nitrosomonas]|uniref:hypothetical protein n=1 Tax=Nitrosomonas TaxID=914 RepID=UPI00094470D2|nr:MULTISPECIES: hypothetical protein [Nitrosomonas]MXS80060.1 hypothetical protein [Nitrosomonas sp. GH22]